MSVKRYMIDLETLGLKHDAVILSIGVVEFDLEGPIPDRELYIELDTSAHGHCSIDPDTVKFWFEETKKGNPPPMSGTVGHHDACWLLIDFLMSLGKDDEIWCNGTDFDIPKLQYFFESNGISVPWKYNQVRDLRTLAKIFPGADRPENPHKHNALSDAKYQAMHASNILWKVDYE